MTCYLCEVCGHVFREPDLHSYTDHGPDGIRIPYPIAICPECGSEEITLLTEEESL